MATLFRLSPCCFAVVLSIAPMAFAQTTGSSAASTPENKKEAASVSDALNDKARELFAQGRKDADAGRWASARASLLAAWSLKPHWQIAANLGRCEEELGLHADAAAHYAYYLRESPTDRKQKAKALFEKVRAKVGEVKVHVDRAGTEVVVDGNVVGRSPLTESVFVMPGKHVLQMRMVNEVLAEQSIDAAAGGTYDVTLAAKAEQPTPPQTADATPPQPKQQPRQQPQPPPSEDSKLPVRKIVLGAGIATTAIGLAGGITFTALSSAARFDSDSARAAVIKSGGNCMSGSPAFSEGCQAFHDAAADRDRYRDVAIAGYVIAGSAAVATAAYLLWPRKKAKTAEFRHIRFLPTMSRQGGGIGVAGSF